MDNPTVRAMEQLILTDGRYSPVAYAFLHDGLNRAATAVHGEGPVAGARHVTGRQLCLALRDLAIERYGQLARTVLARWKIRSTLDFGRMVYLLIENGYMKKTDEDSVEDFRDVYDFEQAFPATGDFEMKE